MTLGVDQQPKAPPRPAFPRRGDLLHFAPALLIAALVLWHVVHNARWLAQNQVLTGWDKARHLAQSLTYNNLLSPLTLQSFFRALISDSVRPPLAPMSAVIMYRLFGTSADAATMLNIVYLALTLIATYKIGVLLRDRGLGMLSALFLALLPMFYAMSRYFYLEFPLTTIVTLTIWALLASKGFQNRAASLLFGLCLGLGLLTKRTYVAFVFAPVGLIVLQSQVLPRLWRRARQGVKLNLKHLALALGGGLALAALWILPIWSTVQARGLGGWLLPIWAALAAVTIYLILRQPAPDTNFLTAAALGTTVGSIWYLTNVSFVQRMLLFGYGVNDPRGRTINVGNPYTYVDYLVRLVNQHISLLIVLLLLAAAVILAVAFLLQRRPITELLRVGTSWWAIILWIAGPYLILTLSIYHEARAITPVLPAVALLGSGLILKLPWRRVALALVILLLVFGIVQFYAISFAPLHGLVQATAVRLPLLGETSLLARGGYLQLPDSLATDSRFWIEPDVLQRMEARRVEQGWDSASLGLLVNANQINFEHFAYLTLAKGYHPQLVIERLARAHGPEPVYPRLFENDFLLVTQANDAVDADSQEVIDQILDQPPPLFRQSFDLEKRYVLPGGGTVDLFQRRYRPPAGPAAEHFPALAQELSDLITEGNPGRDLVVVSPPSLIPLMGQHAARSLNVHPLTEAASPEAMAQMVAGQDRVLAIFGEGDAEVLDQAGRRWLDEHAFRAQDTWFGPTQLVVYGLASPTAPTISQSVDADLGGQVKLQSYELQTLPSQRGGMLLLTLHWQAQKPIDTDLKVFAHLVDSDGHIVAQRDSQPASGRRPTTTWALEETVTDRLGLLLPPEDQRSPGDYHLLVGMYDPNTLERLPLLDSSGNTIGDSINLGPVPVPASP